VFPLVVSLSNHERARILIVYSRVGGGHLSAARALAAEFERIGALEVRLVDAYVECGRWPVNQFPRLYAELARHHPRVWAALFHATNRSLDPSRGLRVFLRGGFGAVLRQFQPRLIVSVVPAINQLLAEAAWRLGSRLEVVVTDWHSVHRFWVAQGVEHYTVPTESAQLDCVRFGAPASAIDTIGIPVRHEFSSHPSDRVRLRQAVLRELGLEPTRLTILAMVGAEGSPRALRNLQHLVQLEADAQTIVVCGRNHQLRRDLERLRSRLALRAVGFVDGIAGLMRSADVLVTKAGGLTLAEAFCCGLPVVVHDVLPGQEAGNLAYVLRQQAVEYAPTPTRLTQIAMDLLRDPERRAGLAQRGHRLARPDAARHIAHAMLTRLSYAPSVL
jgi:UDP-N-acetylglucosamine:LPS N-acetylglucosamine transferase